MSCSVFKPTTRGRQSRFYSAKIRLEGWARPKVVSLRVTHKDVALEKAMVLVRDYERESVGLLPLAAVRRGSRMPLAEHLAAFLEDVKGRGRSPATVRVYRVVLGQVFKGCKWRTPSDADAATFSVWRSASGISPKYANNALGYARTFFGWLVKNRHLAGNPLTGVERVRVREDRGARYVPTLEKLRELLAAVPAARRAAYTVAIYTGLRRSELNGLKWGDVKLDSAVPSVCVPGSISKNAKTSVLPLHVEAVGALRGLCPDLCQPFEWVFRGRLPNPKTFRRDMARVGIPARDEYGRRFDFHALRTAFGTLLSSSGVSPRVAMELMRHSEIKLTMKTYLDVAHLPLAAGLAVLPSLSPSGNGEKTHTSKSDQNPVISGQIGSS